MAILTLRGGGAASVPNATTTVAGKVRLSTIAEALAGTSESVSVTPAGLSSALSSALGSNTQIETFTVSSPPQATFTLGAPPTLDATGDAVCGVVLGGWTAEQGVDFSVSGADVAWISPDVALAAGERLVITYSYTP
jgi:hypothetical protein